MLLYDVVRHSLVKTQIALLNSPARTCICYGAFGLKPGLSFVVSRFIFFDGRQHIAQHCKHYTTLQMVGGMFDPIVEIAHAVDATQHMGHLGCGGDATVP